MINKNSFLPIKNSPNASVRLICFPYAGGSASVFNSWSELFSDDVEIIAAQPPGRTVRIAERPHTTMDNLVEEYMGAIDVYLDKPYLFFGHSLGSRVAYALTKQIQKRGLPMPKHVIASGSGAPHLNFEREKIYNLPNDKFKRKLRELNGTPKEVLENQELLDLFTPMLRADFEIAENYCSEKVKINSPITVLGGIEDTDVTEERLLAWKELSIYPSKTIMACGDHFFIHSNREAVINEVTNIIDSILVQINIKRAAFG
ncbi:thioesterase II family protein [Pseudoalteromonas luteoviolacea]|uniref:Thioesterase domain-containing protein n=1 Tax=Pseudoalteromonas luteoviolacea S4054 TaxID=1129367 RepID=A0A0F6A8R7_9GAMM|nr:thioesterase domain-containing protein [Pseudoalteromonas luteoviolacea]AOT10872.1 hypothetical protein S4054249_23805 [Pseudoalteromonas luteoviolacea]AOT15965.1 hypothetical protein S40542_24705 [Pseudoalteromonas luteoviolacea]AOT20693.1 hypothetical protein S4054_23725 [Pseudoalteromonas luteoviolacea]KKE81794.1 hypothetical protein N479_02205 [Pseudoalteromonas luteoviolacea S4054]KZN66248.1 hypothetical protein N481_24875 [Pseudoalteromonas luteoviolacea S4047-1]